MGSFSLGLWDVYSPEIPKTVLSPPFTAVRLRESNFVGPMPSEHVKVFFCWGKSVTLSVSTGGEREKKKKERTDGKSVPFCRNWGDGGRRLRGNKFLLYEEKERKNRRRHAWPQGREERVQFRPFSMQDHKPSPSSSSSVCQCVFLPSFPFLEGGEEKEIWLYLPSLRADKHLIKIFREPVPRE